jgi:hypothetical protein
VNVVPGPDGMPAGIVLGPGQERILFEGDELLVS